MEKPPNWKEMDDAAHARARDFAARALNSLGRLIDQMQLKRGEAEFGFAYLLAESVSHQTTKHERQFVAQQLQEFVAVVAEDFAEARSAGKPN